MIIKLFVLLMIFFIGMNIGAIIMYLRLKHLNKKTGEEITKKQFDSLKRGDIIQHKVLKTSYVIDSIYQNKNRRYYIAVTTININNPSEWIKINN